MAPLAYLLRNEDVCYMSFHLLLFTAANLIVALVSNTSGISYTDFTTKILSFSTCYGLEVTCLLSSASGERHRDGSRMIAADWETSVTLH